MLTHPQFDPIIFSLGPIAVRWYGLMYVIGFIAVIVLGKLRVRQGLAPGLAEDVDDLLIYGVLGTILGGRLGYVLSTSSTTTSRIPRRSCRSGRAA